MNCIIEGIDFFNLEAMKYFSPSTSWTPEKKKENAMNKIFSGEWWGSQKRDGIFVMVGRNQDGEIFLRPRSRNTKKEFVNKIDWVPQIHSFLNSLECETVFLGELYLPRDEQAKSSSSIMNSLLPRALKKQEKEEDKLHLYIFDCLADRGESYLNMKAIDRFLTVKDYGQKCDNPYVEWAEYKNGKELWELLQNLLADGYEGVVITQQDAPYQPGKRSNKISLKIKKELQDTIDCVVIGAESPTRLYNGKEIETWPYWFDESENRYFTDKEYLEKWQTNIYAAYADGAPVYPVTKNWFYGWAGSLKLGLYDGDKLVHVGDLSGLTEEIRKNWKKYVNTVVEISCMEISKDKNGKPGFRHPRAINFLRDKEPKECTMEQIR